MVLPQRAGYVAAPVESVPFDGHRSAASFEIPVSKSFCPTTTSAGFWLVVGIEFQISTRLLPKIRNVEPGAVTGHRDRIQKSVGMRVPVGLGQIRLYRDIEIGLAQHDVGRLAVLRRNRIPDQDAMILRIGDEQFAVLNPHTLRTAKTSVIHHHCALQDGSEIGLAQFEIRGLSIHRRNGFPDHDAIVRGIGHCQDFSIGSDSGRQPKAALGDMEIHAGEIRLAEHGAGFSDARSAACNIRLDRIERSRKRLRREQQYAIIYRREAGAVGIGNEQSSVGKSHAAHRRPAAYRMHPAAGP